MLVVEIGRAEILTHQLFTCKMVRPVSWASCFFCSSDGYGCCGRERKHAHMSSFDIQININIHTCTARMAAEDKQHAQSQVASECMHSICSLVCCIV